MIKNQRQYEITKAQLHKFNKAIKKFDMQKSNVHPILIKAQKDALCSQAEDLKAQIEEYDRFQWERKIKYRQTSSQDIVLEQIMA